MHLGLKNNSAPDLFLFYALGCSSMDYDLIVVEYGQEGENCVEIISECIVEKVVFTMRLHADGAEVATFSLGDVLEERREK